jgi:exosome complex RNA-binding protein Rrp42 (RNase PH superfamily)
MFNPISNIEKNFLLKNLIKGIREDERSLDSYRNISIKKLAENGQVQVKIGNTLIISQVFAKLVVPIKERPNEGSALFSVNIKEINSNIGRF